MGNPAFTAAIASLPAHGVGTRQDLPLPFTAVLIGAAAALLVSFVALGALWPEPKLRADSGLALPSRLARTLSSPVFRGFWVTVALLITAWTMVALVFGLDDANNPVPYVVFVWLWVGLAALSLIFGPIWAWLNPIRWLHNGLARLARLDPESSMTTWSPGYWPAAMGLFAFTWLELIAPDRTTLLVLRVAIGAFVLIDLLGALVFGRGWFSRGDPFEVWSRLYGSLSPLARRPDRVWVLRSPLHGANAVAVDRGLLATASVMLGSTAGHHPTHCGYVSGSPRARMARRIPGLSTSRTRLAYGLTVRVQSPSTPQDSGTTIHTTSQNTVGTMFSATSLLPSNPHSVSRNSNRVFRSLE